MKRNIIEDKAVEYSFSHIKNISLIRNKFYLTEQGFSLAQALQILHNKTKNMFQKNSNMLVKDMKKVANILKGEIKSQRKEFKCELAELRRINRKDH